MAYVCDEINNSIKPSESEKKAEAVDFSITKMLNLFNSSLKEVKNSETDTFDQAKTSDRFVISMNGLHAEKKGDGGWYST